MTVRLTEREYRCFVIGVAVGIAIGIWGVYASPIAGHFVEWIVQG